MLWKDKEETFPRLSKIAKKLLCIQGSSVASESSFSIGRHVIRFDRASLKTETIRSIMRLKSWYKLIDSIEELPQEQEDLED